MIQHRYMADKTLQSENVCTYKGCVEKCFEYAFFTTIFWDSPHSWEIDANKSTNLCLTLNFYQNLLVSISDISSLKIFIW